MKRLLVTLLLIATLSPIATKAQEEGGTVDIFMGVDLNYKDIWFNNRVFDVLVNLTPGVKWNIGKRWAAAGDIYVPVYNHRYGHYYDHVRLHIASLTWQHAVGSRWKMKFSGGAFGVERYGLDMKNMFIVNKWLAFRGEIGVTGHLSMVDEWTVSTMKILTWQLGADFWLSQWTTQFTLTGGRYLYGDYGIVGEAWRHFKHTSVGLYANYSSRWKEDMGFKVIVMLPPYKRTRHRVNFRPASNFRLTYSGDASPYSTVTFATSPEENEREGWFDHDLLPWGPSTMEPDFTVKERKEDSK